MKNHLLRSGITFLMIAFFVPSILGQGGIDFRLAINSGMFLSEPGSSGTIADPYAILNSEPGGVDKFKSDIKLGIEAELFVPISDYFGIGFEVANSKYAGHNDKPIYYNYFASVFSPILNYAQEPLSYNTKVTNLLGNIRIFPFGHGLMSPYIKLFGGVGMIGTDLRFTNPKDQTEKYDPLYSRGTRLSVAEPKKFNAAQFGGGPGFEYNLGGKLSLCTELTFSYIKSDIINGIPNFTYDELKGQSVYDEVPSITGKISIGLSYKIGGDSKGKHTKSFRTGKGRSYRRSSIFGR